MLQSGQSYSDQTFKHQKLDLQYLQSAEFHGCTFKHCTLVEASLVDCRFVDCAFLNCDLSLAHIPGSAWIGVRFERSKLVGINWAEASWPDVRLGEPLSFQDCALNHATFLGLDLSGARFGGCTAIGVDFREADISRADFSGCDLLDSLFMHTNLSEADLSKARNYNIAAAENTLKKARFALPEALSLLYGLDIVLEDGV